MCEMVKAYYRTEIGLLEIAGDRTGIAVVRFCDEEPEVRADEVPEPLQECVHQLEEYFQGRREKFTVKLAPSGTVFQRRVWEKLCEIPYGSTINYSQLAARIANPQAVRAVGHANGQNPIWIIIPCHRVIGKDGTLRGYAGGLWRKEWLLRHEEKYFSRNPF